MENKVILSEKFTLQWRDALKGLIVAVITVVLGTLVQFIEGGGNIFDADWKQIGSTAIIAGVGYLIKNFWFEPAKVITVSETNTEAKKVESSIKEVV